jgi:Leucine-rich repeat (LRR) protein
VRAALVAVALTACAHEVRPPVVVPAPPPPPPPVVHVAAPLWPVPMRVMTWTPAGVLQVGELPGAAVPTTPWYVEPEVPLTPKTFARVVAAVRSEHVPGLSLRGQRVDAAQLGALRDLPELTALVLDDSDVDGDALAQTQLDLHRLYLAHTAVDDSHLVALLARQPHLEVLALEGCDVGDPTARAAAALPALVAINFNSTHLTDYGGSALGALANLQIADLGHTRVAAQTVAALAPLALRQLFLDHTSVGRELSTLGMLAPSLEQFDVSSLASYHPTDADLSWLTTAPHLIEIGVSDSTVHDAFVLAVATAPGLRTFRLGNTKITPKAIHALAKLTALEELDLGDTPVDDASAAAILAFPHLRVLRLDHTPITDTGLAVATPSPALVELYVSRDAVGDTGLALISALPNLVGLGIGETRAGDATLVRVAALKQLRTLVATNSSASVEQLARVAALPHLERLYLDETRTDDTVIATLGKNHGLTALHVGSTNVSDEALPQLHLESRLEELAIGDTRVTGRAISDLAAWPRLTQLSLLGLAIDDDDVLQISNRRALVTLDLSSTDVQDLSPLEYLHELETLGLQSTRLNAAGQAAVRQMARFGVEIVR